MQVDHDVGSLAAVWRCSDGLRYKGRFCRGPKCLIGELMPR